MAGTLKIRLYGDPCLRKKSAYVRDVGPAERILIHSMLETMYENKGIGLAAPQVGINQQIFVIDAGDGPFVVVNPKIIKKSGSSEMEEGCLSIPGVTVMVKRPQKIWVSYTDENSETVKRELSGLTARAFLHENDHINGKLIVDYADKKTLVEIKKQWPKAS